MSWTLQQLIDIPNLQMLMDRFYAATSIPVGILASDGEILVATGWQEICTHFHRTHPVTAARCRQSDDYIKTALITENHVQYKCRNGLWDLAVPIIIAGEHVATLFLGQFFYDDEEIDEEFFRAQSRECGFDVDLYIAALKRIPVFTREKVRQIMEFYTSFVNFLVSVGLANFQRAETEKTLRESEEKFARIFNTAPISMAISTIEEGEYLEVNETFQRLYGFSRDEVIGHTSAELSLWNDPHERQEIVEQLKRGEEIRDRELTLRDREGRLHVGLFSGALIDLHGEKRLLSLRNDITERKRMEEEIKTLNSVLASHAAELEAANRELEAFNYSVSHDLRAPLTKIIGFCDLLKELDPADQNAVSQSYLRHISEAGRQMECLIETLLEFSHMSRSPISRETVDLTEIAKEVILQMQMNDPYRKVTFAVAEGVTAQGDERLLGVVMTNLIGNAWKYTGKRESPLIEFGTTEINGVSVYFVRDNGEGFDMVHTDKLFQPFERLPGTDDFAGHGIGLASVQRIILRHGGRVWGEGQPGKGATFFFTLWGNKMGVRATYLTESLRSTSTSQR